MNVLIDTNVALDVLLNRSQFYDNSAFIYVLSENGFLDSYISVSSITDIFYLTQKEYSKQNAYTSIKKLIQVYHPVTITDTNIFQAFELGWDDFEDAVQYIAGRNISADYIITRNVKDFAGSSIEALTPEQFLDRVIDE
ncbi:MAG: PIN domain-containing protein [Treponema sp.]|jgi:predicted nucleic acid-binding protein|nr:PIN domain-containing protein [Treponema sp.]